MPAKVNDTPVLEKEFNEDYDVDKAISEGSILSRIFIEVQGNDKDACQKALENTILGKLASEQGLKLLHVKFYEITDTEDVEDKKNTFYSGFVEVKAVFRDFRWMVNIVMRYGPTAIEIVEPEEVRLDLEGMQALLADVSQISQTFSSHILALLKDDERRAAFERIVGSKQGP